MPKIRVSLNSASIDNAIRQLESYNKKLETAGNEIAKRLCEIGYDVASGVMGGHIYTGETISSLRVEKVADNRYVLKAGSKALLFFEFGAGVIGYGHPLAGKFHMGPGTYPGKGHWNNPKGWFYPTDDPALVHHYDEDGQGWAISHGNAPHMPFYQADVAIREQILTVAREVLSGD